MILHSARIGLKARRWTSSSNCSKAPCADVEHAGLHEHGGRIEDIDDGRDADRQAGERAVDLGVGPHLPERTNSKARAKLTVLPIFSEIMPARARSEATVSRQPMLPQPQRRPPGSTVMWPISPANPLCPAMTWPPLMTAAPSPPVASTRAKSSMPRAWPKARSPRQRASVSCRRIVRSPSRACKSPARKRPSSWCRLAEKQHLLLPPVDQPRGGQSQGQRGSLFLPRHQPLGMLDDCLQERARSCRAWLKRTIRSPRNWPSRPVAAIEHSRISTTAPSTPRRLIGRAQDLGRSAENGAGRSPFFQQVRGQQRTNEFRDRRRADARQPDQFGPRQPAVGLHGFQNPPLVHAPQQVRDGLAAADRRHDRSMEDRSCSWFPGLYPAARIFPAGSEAAQIRNVRCHRLVRWSVTLVATHITRLFVAPRSPATAWPSPGNAERRGGGRLCV